MSPKALRCPCLCDSLWLSVSLWVQSHQNHLRCSRLEASSLPGLDCPNFFGLFVWFIEIYSYLFVYWREHKGTTRWTTQGSSVHSDLPGWQENNTWIGCMQYWPLKKMFKTPRKMNQKAMNPIDHRLHQKAMTNNWQQHDCDWNFKAANHLFLLWKREVYGCGQPENCWLHSKIENTGISIHNDHKGLLLSFLRKRLGFISLQGLITNNACFSQTSALASLNIIHLYSQSTVLQARSLLLKNASAEWHL